MVAFVRGGLRVVCFVVNFVDVLCCFWVVFMLYCYVWCFQV